MSKTTIAGSNTTYTLTAGNSPLYNVGIIDPTSTGSGAIGVYSNTTGVVSLTNDDRIYGTAGSGVIGDSSTLTGGTGGFGVEFKSAGTVANYGLIEGGAGGYGYDQGGAGAVGVSLTGTLSNLVNRGGDTSLAGVYGGVGGPTYGGTGGTGGTGVVLNAGATLSNYTHIKGGAGGGVAGTGVGGSGGYGVKDPGGGTVTNFATIDGGAINYGTTGTVGGTGVYVEGGTLNNRSPLGSTVDIQGGSVGPSGAGSGGVGVEMMGGAVTNDLSASIGGGSINTHNTGTGSGGVGAILTNAARLSNYGNLAGGSATGGNGGVGVKATGTVATGFNIVNMSSAEAYGHIAGGSSVSGTGGNAVDLYGGASAFNNNAAPVNGFGGFTGGGSTSGSGGVGVDLLATGASLDNVGSIYGGSSASGTGGAGVELAAGTTVDNMGSIDGGTSASAGGGVGVLLNGGEFVNVGSIRGGGIDGSDANLANAVQFGAGPATLELAKYSKVYGDIAGFAHGDTIWVPYLTQGTVQADFNPLSDVLTLPGPGGGHVIDFTGPAGSLFQFGTDINGGTDITIACFRRGTQILTPHGERAIEALRIGDEVVTLSGHARPIRFIGSRRYSRLVAAGNRDVLPVRIRAGALAEGIPRRDLWVSPDHAMYVEGLLIPARALVNGESILQDESVEDVSYFHVEFATHDVIYAEGAPSESFVDDDSRQFFDNAAEYALRYPQAVATSVRFCAPRVEDGELLEVVRRRLAERGGASMDAAWPAPSPRVPIGATPPLR